MSKNIKRLISETFNEVYNEIINEEPQVLKKNSISDNEVDDIINKAKKTGRGISYEWTVDKKSQDNFNYIIDALIKDYKETGNPNSKSAIQNAFTPTSHPQVNKIFRTSAGNFITNNNIEDAVMSAYEQVMINNFDNTISNYKENKTFGGLITKALNNRINNFIVRGYGYETKPDDLFGNNFDSPKSFETPKGGKTLGDKLAATTVDTDFADIENSKDGKRIINDVIEWFQNHLDSKEYPVNEKQFIAFKGIIKGESPQQIFDDNPGVFTKPKDVNIYFDRLVNSKSGKEISELISDIYNINFDLSKINKAELSQTSSMNPEFGGFSKEDEKSNDEMIKIMDKIKNKISELGFGNLSNKINPKITSNTEEKLKPIFDYLKQNNNEEDALDILSMVDELGRVKEKTGFGKKIAYLPKSEKEEEESDEFRGMFESLNEKELDKILERVVNRILKK